jgi:hypothetical protein
VKLFLDEYKNALTKNFILPNGTTLFVLRFEAQEKGGEAKRWIEINKSRSIFSHPDSVNELHNEFCTTRKLPR